MELQNSRDLLIAIKQAREAKRIPLSQLLTVLDERNQSISRTTLNRVFADGSEDNDAFSYNTTLKPLAEYLLEEDDGQVNDSPCSNAISALRADIRIKNEIISIKEIEINSIKESLDFYKGQIDIKDRRLDDNAGTIQRLMDRLDMKDEIIRQFLVDMKQKDDIINRLESDLRNVATGK